MKRRIMDIVQEKPWLGWTIFLGTVIIVFLIGLLGASIIERRGEADLLVQAKPIKEWEPRNEIWGANYPREYETYTRTADGDFLSKHGGNQMIDYLDKYPNLVILWAGYAFSRDYNQGRGHYHAIEDIRQTLRTDVPQPATCWSCKSTDVPRVMNIRGPGAFYKDTWTNLGSEIVNNIGCQDCHDPKTMNLRITRPALIEAFQRQGKDINQSTHQEMRTLVCAQCHVEYYFKGKEEKYLTFPWDKGFSADDMEKYYDEVSPHTDFVHALSRTPILKAQHPDYELYMTGIHAKRGVSCADCHMPYRSEGGVKFTNHKIMSPLQDVAGSCQVCHRESEANLIRDVYERQDKIEELRMRAEGALAKAHIEAKFAWDKGAAEKDMEPVLTLIRQSQWRWDWVAAANGLGFHSPVEAARTLGASIEKAEQARRLLVRILAKRGYTDEIPLPDISTKAKAQAYIGLDPEKMKSVKAEFVKNVVPTWDAAAKAREAKY
ncbi:MAG: ammonia-forming cytochrome c nitrite reductase [Bacteroidota bacterium]|jgi:nitrite reductase (cytochrome c-552)|nr:ammonia-forming cytochrome c nitrite reductase [Bacteroidota bacterium]